MAGLVSGPRPQRQPEVVFVPQPPPRSLASSSADGSGKGRPPSDSSSGEQDKNTSSRNKDGGAESGQVIADGQRAAGILASKRGREATIRTGFKGILDKKQTRARRKTLLGE